MISLSKYFPCRLFFIFTYYYHLQLRSPCRVCPPPSPDRAANGQLTRPCSYLTYLLTPKPSESPTTSTVVSRDSRDRDPKDVSTKISAYTSSLYDSFTEVLSDFAGRDGGKTVKFPERLIKVLEGKLQDIFMAKDPKCGGFPIPASLLIRTHLSDTPIYELDVLWVSSWPP